VDGDCDQCSEQGAGRFDRAVAVARTDDGTLLIAYVHANLDRHFDYDYWCTNPDGDFCSCSTVFWDEGSSFELRLSAVTRRGRVIPILTEPLEGATNGNESTNPGDMVALDAGGDRAALAVRFASRTVRVMLVDISGIEALAGSSPLPSAGRE